MTSTNNNAPAPRQRDEGEKSNPTKGIDMSKTTPNNRCYRCRRRWRGQLNWNSEWKKGRFIGLLCAECQTPEETAEAAVNEALLTYTLTPFGQVVVTPKRGR